MMVPSSPEEAQRLVDLQAMTAQDNSHRMIAFLDGLDEEQTTQLKSLLVTIRDCQELGAVIANYWVGMCVMKLHVNNAYCPGCGKNHTPANAAHGGVFGA